MLDALVQKAGEAWCRLMHDDITTPRHGVYRCRKCNRIYPVPWQEAPAALTNRRASEPFGLREPVSHVPR